MLTIRLKNCKMLFLRSDFLNVKMFHKEILHCCPVHMQSTGSGGAEAGSCRMPKREERSDMMKRT